MDEKRSERWKRRALTGPALLCITPLYLSALPATLAGTATYDLLIGRRLTATRFTAALGVNLSMHTAAFMALFSAWLLGGRWAGSQSDREERIEQRLQSFWARTTWQACALIYGMSLEVEGSECASPGPVLILPRHSSLIDTLLPLVLLTKRDGLRLRYVMKRELLWDPVIDALGHRWPTAFVRRGTRDPAELDRVVHLSDDIGERDGIVLFPEGTRFSDQKRDHILEKLRQSDPQRFEQARRLKHLLPPHPAGILALLDAAPVDPVFVAHTGLEGANHFQDLLGGTLVNTVVRVKLWRVARSEIPSESSQRLAWLNEQWQAIDDWIEETQSQLAR